MGKRRTRRNNGRSQATVFKPGTSFGTIFTDTVEILTSATGTGFFLGINELLPSLQSGSNREFVFRRFRIEVLPSNDINTPARIAQVRYRSKVMDEFTALAPYKVLSRVNPTMLTYSVDRLARICPSAKAIASTVDTTLVFNLGFANENRESVVARITTEIQIFPQTNTLTTLRLADSSETVRDQETKPDACPNP